MATENMASEQRKVPEIKLHMAAHAIGHIADTNAPDPAQSSLLGKLAWTVALAAGHMHGDHSIFSEIITNSLEDEQW